MSSLLLSAAPSTAAWPLHGTDRGLGSDLLPPCVPPRTVLPQQAVRLARGETRCPPVKQHRLCNGGLQDGE